MEGEQDWREIRHHLDGAGAPVGQLVLLVLRERVEGHACHVYGADRAVKAGEPYTCQA